MVSYMKRDTGEIALANLRVLMASREEWSSANGLARASRSLLNQTTISRWLSGERRPSMEALGVLAGIFSQHISGFQAWMLIYPDLDPLSLPMCVADDEREIVERVRKLLVQHPQENEHDDPPERGAGGDSPRTTKRTAGN